MSAAVLLVCLSCPAVHKREDIHRFPCFDVCESASLFQHEYQEHLKRISRLGGREKEWADGAFAETLRRQRAWTAARFIALDYSPEWTRYYLNELRDLLSEEDYVLGRLPSPVNLHFFSRR